MVSHAPFLDVAAERWPERPAVETSCSVVTFAQLRERARRRASALERCGVRPADRVALLLPSGLEFLEIFHALDRLGATVLPLHLRLTERELAFQLSDADAALLVHGAGELAERGQRLGEASGTPTRALDELSGRASTTGSPVDPEAALALLYTSGTTGTPKGALLSRRAFAASARASAVRLGTRGSDRWLACLPLYHVGGLSLLTRATIDGTGLVVHDGFDARRVSDRLDAGDVTGVSFVPTMLERVLDERSDAPPPPALRVVLLGGAAAPDALIARAGRAGFPIAPTYGLTEACSQVATRSPGASGTHALPPLPDTSLRIVDERGIGLPTGTVGEIEVCGPSLMSGYWRRPDATAATLRDGWLRTGDVGRLDETGALYVLDRRSDLIVSGGENIYPVEIERVLVEHPDVREAGVAGIDDARFGRRPAAWIVPTRDDPDLASIEHHCRRALASYKVPVRFFRVDRLPRNALGKLLRRSLPLRPDESCEGREAAARN